MIRQAIISQIITAGLPRVAAPSGEPEATILSGSDYTTSAGALSIRIPSVPSNSVLVLSWADEAAGSTIPSLTSTPSLTWTKRADGAEGNAEIYTAVYSAGGGITASIGAAAVGDQSAVLYAVPSGSGLGNVNSATAQTEPSISLSVTSASYVFGVTSDWSAKDGTGATFSQPVTVALSVGDVGVSYWAYHYYWRATATGGDAISITSPTSQDAGTAVVEIKV